MPSPDTLAKDRLRAVRKSRRDPSLTQHDYLHLRAVVDGLAKAFAAVPKPVHDVLDVWCGSRPYDDLLPAGARVVGLDIEGNPYGIADVVSNTFLPFLDDAFDLVTCIEAFQYVSDARHAVSEFARVLRPGGSVAISMVFAYEYDRRIPFEARYTEQQLRELFAGWDDVRVREDGGRTVTWTVLTASLLFGLEQRTRTLRGNRPLRAAFASCYALLNSLGVVLARLEGGSERSVSLPMNLTLTARKPRHA